jgi:hypothetical protein
MSHTWLDRLEQHLRDERPLDALNVLQDNERSHTRLGRAAQERLISAARQLSRDKRLKYEYRLEVGRIARTVEGQVAQAERLKRAAAAEKASLRKAEREARERKRAEDARIQRAAAKHHNRYQGYVAAGLSPKRASILTLMPAGPYSVSITGLISGAREDPVADRLVTELGFTAKESVLLVERAVHIAPEAVAFDVDQSRAVQLKKALERAGAKIRIDMASRREANERRLPIPQSVRHEVWRRDGGRCVDCGSAENLHYDHIIPWSRGGANTPRNLELRCERCNLRKGARI